MPVNERQAILAERTEEWQRLRDAVAGNDAVKSKGPRYLPRVGGQTIVKVTVPNVGEWLVDEYEAYKMRANWYNASSEAVKEMVGALFRKAPIWNVPPAMKPDLQDITHGGESIEMLAQRIVEEIVTVGYVGVLVDVPKEGDTMYPYWVLYRAEEIMRVQEVVRDGMRILSRIVLEETAVKPSADEFEEESITRYRVFELDADGFLVVRRFERVDRRTTYVQVSEIYPIIRGNRLTKIPFVCFNANDLSVFPQRSPILDVVDVNFSHYRTSADLEEGLHKLAVPTPYAAGFSVDKELRLGANVAYQSENPQARIAFAEFSGAGLGQLRQALLDKEQQMDTIRGQLMGRQKGGVESAEAIRLRTAGGQNVLITLANTVSAGLTRLLAYHANWMAIREPTIMAEVNHDFVEMQLTPQEQAANLDEYHARVISYETLYYRMQRGEMTRPGVDAAQELAEIAAEQPLDGEEEFTLEPIRQAEDAA